MQILAFVLYFVVVLTIGIVFFLRSKTGGEKEYFLGGRSMGPWVTAMSAQASDMSGWLLMGFPGSILAFGMGQMWIGVGLALGTALNWIIVARRLRRFSNAANDSITLPQYLTNRFASSSPVLKIVCAVIFLISFTVYVASAFSAGTSVFVAVLPQLEGKESLAMIIFAVIILLYTFLGGYKAVCWTDFFQGILMLCALLAVPIAMKATGAFDPQYTEAFADGVTAFNTNPFTADWREIVSGLAWGFGYFGMPHILVRFMSIKKSNMIKKASTVAIIWVVLTLGAAILISYFGRTYLLEGGESLAATLLPAGAQQKVFIKIVLDIFPAFIAGILLAAIVAASMSTADSQLLVASSSFTSDIYKPIIRKNKASDKETLWIGRVVVLIIAVIAFVIAYSGLGGKNEWAGNIMSMVENAWGLFGASFGPVVILSLFWKRFNYPGAVAGIVGGALVDILWLVLFTDTVMAPVVFDTGVYEILPGFVAGAIVAVVVTLLTKAPTQEVCAIYDKAVDKAIDD